MLLVTCLNPALDITHHVPAVDWAGVNRPTAVFARPGGKGTNVARVLRSFGMSVLLTGFAGGTTGTAVETELGRLGVPTAFTPVAGETRRTFTVVDGPVVDSTVVDSTVVDSTVVDGNPDGVQVRVALFNEPGPEVSEAEFTRFRRDYDTVLTNASVVVLSGSLPPGVAPDGYARLIEAANSAGVPAVLDTSGEALRAGVAAGPAIVKPNLDELGALVGSRLRTPAGETDLAAVTAAAAALRADGAGSVVVSLGPDGLLAVTGDGCWRALAPVISAGNATGAGDAVTAALAHGVILGQRWPERLRHAVALGAAAVAAPAAGEFSVADYEAGLRSATVSACQDGDR
jgi:tagatose 6-phosphate kinase